MYSLVVGRTFWGNLYFSWKPCFWMIWAGNQSLLLTDDFVLFWEMSRFEQKRRVSCKSDTNQAYLGIFYAYLGILAIAFCLLPMPGWMYTASECILPPNAYCLWMHTASECIRRPNAFRGSMHSEAVCNRRQYAIKPECNQLAYCLLPIASCLLPIA